jgi:choline-phosphate cytidylyltransferase
MGVIGTGRIAVRFMQDQKYVPEVQVTCVYNPHMDSVKRFLRKTGAVHGTYGTDDWDELMERVDAVYIASPHGFHVETAKNALLRGKHVLCEKPMAFCRQDAEMLYDLAAERGLVLMEAVKTAHFPGFQRLLEVARDGRIGEIRDVEACFTKLEDPAGRELTDPVYGGSFVELGTYAMLPILALCGSDYEDLQFQSVKNEKGMDLFTKVIVTYPSVFGMGKVGLGVKSEGDLIISGTKGYIYAEAPWWLAREFEVRYEDPDERDCEVFLYDGSGLQYELKDFANEIASQSEQYSVYKNMSIALADIMGQFLNRRKEAR